MNPIASEIIGSVLIVDDMPDNLALIAEMLNGRGHKVRLAVSGAAAIASALAARPDIILLDINMPEMNGFETCGRIKASPSLSSVPVIFLTAQNETADIVKAFGMGAADYVTKPFRREELIARVETHLRLARMGEELRRYNQRLEEEVREKVREIAESQMATITVLASQSEYRDNETGEHIKRVKEFCRCLARHLAQRPEHSALISEAWVESLYHASVLHDIGKVGIPDSILLKEGPLSEEEAVIMKRHTLIGAQTLEAARRDYPNNSFINMGIEVTLYHHERWDGTGYPYGVSGEAIPLSARIMNLVDQYDALRSKRPYKPAFEHGRVASIILQGDGRTLPGHFDPTVLKAFEECHEEFRTIYESY